MILNGSQQSNLFNLLDRGAVGGLGGNVNFVIHGKDLHGVLHNYNDKKNNVNFVIKGKDLLHGVLHNYNDKNE